MAKGLEAIRNLKEFTLSNFEFLVMRADQGKRMVKMDPFLRVYSISNCRPSYKEKTFRLGFVEAGDVNTPVALVLSYPEIEFFLVGLQLSFPRVENIVDSKKHDRRR